MARIGVFVCHCGTNIAATVDVEEVARYAANLPGVAHAQTYKYMCSDPGQELIKKAVDQKQLDRVVVASCSPLLHEATFRGATGGAGLNPFFFQMANIREHVSWVTENLKEATEKAKALVSAAVRRVAMHEPLEKREVPVNPVVMIIGGGIAGIQSALTIANAGRKVFLVEREPSIGGHMALLDKTFPTLDCSACILTPKMSTAGSHPNITLMTYCEVVGLSGFVGNFVVQVRKNARYVDVEKCTSCTQCWSKCPATSFPRNREIKIEGRTVRRVKVGEGRS